MGVNIDRHNRISRNYRASKGMDTNSVKLTREASVYYTVFPRNGATAIYYNINFSTAAFRDANVHRLMKGFDNSRFYYGYILTRNLVPSLYSVHVPAHTSVSSRRNDISLRICFRTQFHMYKSTL